MNWMIAVVTPEGEEHFIGPYRSEPAARFDAELIESELAHCNASVMLVDAADAELFIQEMKEV